MLSERLVATVVVRQGWVVQSFAFERYLPVGHPEVAVEFLAQWNVDEIVLLDISATPDDRGPDFSLVERVARRCFVPLTVGGGVRHLGDVHDLTHAGADKVSVNSAALRTPALLEEGASHYGRQCMVAAIDIRGEGASASSWTCSGRVDTGVHPAVWAQAAERSGAGEVLLTSIPRNGSKRGYDLATLRQVAAAVEVPVIINGGASEPAHFAAGLAAGASAVAAGNYFHFTEHSVLTTRAALLGASRRMRAAAPGYDPVTVDAAGRVGRVADFTFDDRN